MLQQWHVLCALALPVVAASKHKTEPCDALAAALPGLVVFPNSAAYDTHNNYWSTRQAELTPSCFVAPRTAHDVSKAVKILTRYRAPFTVKSGGHIAYGGGSNIEDGITIDLVHLDDITVAPDRKTVSVGAGNRWINVSEALDPLGLAVVGGRSADVGVSGLTLGGGISYFSGRRGWACDNVVNFEVVLSSGAVVNASPTRNRDLFWALRGGGGSNFGIVTRFDLAALSQGDLWASSLIYPGGANATLVPLMHDLLVRGLAADPAAHLYFVITHAPAFGGYIVLTDQFHSAHADTASPPAVFAPFHSVPALTTNIRLANVSRLSRDIAQPYGERQTWWDTTVAATSSPDLLLDTVPLFEAFVARLSAAAEADNSTVAPFLIFQPISLNIIEAMQANGGNALGLKPEDGPLMIMQIAATWSSAALDEVVEENCEQLITEIDALAAERGARSKNGFVYMNYAGRTQDVYAGYGRENLERLRRTAGRWDPNGRFRELWKGHFKL
ncbi:6-hydroxy-D-nicotine oxidase [Madurella fahalii]|uniref:6-hydroxy-D-nicotine oxidase n=1 Tax=Madurella fahalii TaxID=1157608 RepID=A0ABQ0GA06_9PEZI